jgi:hypothetical protein
MNKQVLLSGLTAATLLLSACSAEPSDWRPENKVSLDMVEPGTRSSDNFDQHTEAAPSQEKGGAIEHPVSSHVQLEKREKPNAQQATSANSRETLENKSDEPQNEKATAADPAAKKQ